ncbi:MAG: acyloxyacyl hydrolase [Acidobacteriota bacterium]|nr:acyloxyacyl hydrolase [Acidobacteriota bacterium]
MHARVAYGWLPPLAAILTVLAVSHMTAPRSLAADPGAELAVLVGVFDVGRGSSGAEGGVEIRYPTPVADLCYVAGSAANDEGSFWVYGGARYELEVASEWMLVPGFAVSLYEEGGGKDLGGLVEFRSSLELRHRVSERLKVGLVAYHLSNAGIYDRNPGSNSLVLSFAFRPERRLD